MDGQTLKQRREALGLSQAELGRLLGVMQNTISRWELGLVVIRHPKILDLALEAIEKRKTWGDVREALGLPREPRDG